MPDIDEMFETLEGVEGIEKDDRVFVKRIRHRWDVESIIPSRKERTRLLRIYNEALDVKMPCEVADDHGRCPWMTKRKKAAVTLRCPHNNPKDQATCEGYKPMGKPGYAEVPK